MSAGCGGDLLRMIAQAGSCDKVVVRCRRSQARILRRLRVMWSDSLLLEETGDGR